MIIWLSFRWWYSSGWNWIIRTTLIERSKNILVAFSVGSLLRTLFAPYRQTFTGGVKGSLSDLLRALLDNVISRFVGFFVRLLIITAGIISLIFVFIVGIIIVVCWPIVPLMPIVSLILVTRV